MSACALACEGVTGTSPGDYVRPRRESNRMCNASMIVEPHSENPGGWRGTCDRVCWNSFPFYCLLLLSSSSLPPSSSSTTTTTIYQKGLVSWLPYPARSITLLLRRHLSLFPCFSFPGFLFPPPSSSASSLRKIRPRALPLPSMQSSGLSRSLRSPSAQHFPSGSGSSGDSSAMASAPRSSSSSTRSQSSKSTVPERQINQIEKSVTHLLVATKQLLETLTQWSRRQASENEVSDVYVRLGYEFNLACRAFNAIGVDTSDLGPVPDLLRTILEDTLSQDASPQSLDRYLPRIRDIIINLLHGLKKKQARLRSRQQKEESRPLPGRHTSASSATSGQAALNQAYEETASTVSSSPKRSTRRYGSSGSMEDPGVARASSVPSTDARGSSFSEREASRREAQSILSQTPQLDTTKDTGSSTNAAAYPTPPPPPPPKQDDALGALQRSGELERRASRRFSAYQIQKHLGTSTNGVPVLPTQNSPIPNRGRDVRESLNAVRLRGSTHGRQRSTNRLQEVKTTQAQAPVNVPSIEEERSKPRVESPAELPAEDPTANEDKPTERPEGDTADNSVIGQRPELPRPSEEPSLAEAFEPTKDTTASAAIPPGTPKSERQQPTATTSTPPQSSQYSPEQQSPGKELTLFLQYRSKIKKYVLPEGYAGLTIGRLQLAFIEKFAWNTHNDGVDLPEIYVQDPVSGVRHELEDLNDVKDRSVLVLNVDILDEVKKHFDDEFGGVRRLIEGVKGALEGQESMMQRVSDRQLEAAKEMARLAAAPPAPATGASKTGESRKDPIRGSDSQIAELQSLRRDLAVLRQTYSNFSTDIAGSMSAIRNKAGTLKSAAAEVSVPSFEGDAGRARVNSGKKELAEESERLVARVDDLQDLVEDLRKDVVTRGVRPIPRQLESVSKDISAVTKEIKKMQEFLKREKPVWTKIWEKELQLVCEERDQLTMQEDLAADLQDDLEKAAQTFALVEQATKQQTMQNGTGGPVLRHTSRNVVIDPAVDLSKAKDSVLGEVRALQPNHESRLEAIERAEKARQKELETRRVGLFQKELGAFVEEGKLKKSGGVEEAERLRRTKDDRIRREVWERQQARAAEMEKAEAEAAAAAAQEAQAEPPTDEEPDDAEAKPDANEEVDAESGEEAAREEEDTSKGKAPALEDEEEEGEEETKETFLDAEENEETDRESTADEHNPRTEQ
ncbi:AIP3-domain-containing protein [Aspergillus heteromorphus CBS 117.55]|uniref:AIP3-domain-containing protein n=1 Tax=Aspergillus heteromorphus CBS 117.55 TaxID=1448321 RepID=A0A317W5B9_9EURO|nr:AIP3-domain-containing protein [Aspergillus heteromorphus CBS 117.55]PWY81856.1 AIP3-domain-containing protein [Aspergillus heteromorphus CBS 117.55]